MNRFDPEENPVDYLREWIEGYEFRLSEVDRSRHFQGTTQADVDRMLVWAEDPGTDRQLEALPVLLRRIRRHPRPPYAAEVLLLEHRRLFDIPSHRRLDEDFPSRFRAWLDRVQSYLEVGVDQPEPLGDASGDPASVRNALYDIARCLRLMRDAWKKGDREALNLMANGFGRETSGFKEIVLGESRAPVEDLLHRLNSDLLPFVLPHCDPALRDQVQLLVGQLKLEQVITGDDGEATDRWRQTWAATGLDASVDRVTVAVKACGDGVVLRAAHGGAGDQAPAIPPRIDEPHLRAVHIAVLRFLSLRRTAVFRVEICNNLTAHDKGVVAEVIDQLHQWGLVNGPPRSKRGVTIRDAGSARLKAYNEAEKVEAASRRAARGSPPT